MSIICSQLIVKEANFEVAANFSIDWIANVKEQFPLIYETNISEVYLRC